MKKRPMCLACLILIAGVFLAWFLDLPIFGRPPEHPLLETYTAEGTRVTIIGQVADRAEKKRSVQYILDNSYLRSEEGSIPLYTITMISTGEERLKAGSVISVTGSLSVPEEATNPGQFDLKSYYESLGIYYSLYAESIQLLQEGGGLKEELLGLQIRLSGLVDSLLEPEDGEILKAMLLGDRTGLSDEMKRDYQVGGILHILAISGMHVTLLGSALLKLLQRCRLPLPVAAGLTLLLMGLYCLFTGAAASSVRALLMFAILLGAKLLRRTYDLPCAMALSAILMLLEDPTVLFYSGFQMSFCAILSVAVVWPSVSWLLPAQVKKPGKLVRRPGSDRKEFQRLKGRQLRRWTRYYIRLFLHHGSFWLVMNVSLLPLTAWYYYEIPIWGLIPNLLLVPLAPVLLFLGVAGILTALLNPLAGKLVLAPAAWIMDVFHGMTEWIRSLPLASWVCGKPELWQLVLGELLLILFVVLLDRRKKQMRQQFGKERGAEKEKKRFQKKVSLRLAVGLLLFLLLLFVRITSLWSLTMLDVGQGDCLLLRDRQSAFLIDGGSSSVKEVGKYRILPCLKAEGIMCLQGIFLTHPDEDHMNGLLEVMEAVVEHTVTLRVKKLYLPCWLKGSEEAGELLTLAEKAGTKVVYLGKGDVLRTRAMKITVLAPFYEGGIRSGNSGSLVLSLQCGDFTALLTGDLEEDGERLLLPLDQTYDCLKVAHHGSKGSSSDSFLQQVAPELALISAPEKSRYGHPHQETLERLEKTGSKVLITRDLGALTVEGNRYSWKVRGFRRK